MKNIILFTTILIIGISFSCKKQEDLSIDKIENGEISFSPMEVGNYWIYEVGEYDKDGKYNYLDIDSIYISTTKDINGNTYFEYLSSYNSSYKEYLRDSAGYLINETGEKFFYHKNHNDTIENEIIEVAGVIISQNYRVIYIHDTEITCLAGSFPAIEARSTIYLPLLDIKLVSYYFYSANIGVIIRVDTPDLLGATKVFNLMRWGKE
ncbi:MAG: hypothetical protein KAG84_02000 [Bacteroidales bacterium]|nr:hypothetical protein [Bacteroidales bacterium]